MHDIDVIVLHLVRCRPVIERCMTVVTPEDFNRENENFHSLLWYISHKWSKNNREPIPRTYMDIEVQNELLPVQHEFSDEAIRRLYRLVDWIYAQPEEALVTEHAMRLIQTFLDERRIKPLAAGLADTDSDKFTESLGKMHEEHRKTRLTAQGDVDHIFTPENFFTPRTPRQPTGVAFIDELFNGGTAPGEVYGCVAPTGGGKTTLGAMMFAEFVKQRRHAAFFSYETEFAPQVTNSIFSYIANVPRGALNKLRKEEVDPEHLKAVEEAMREYGTWMHACDMKKDVAVGVGSGGVAEIVANVQMYKNRGQPIELIVIDQMLSMVDSYVGMNAKDLQNIRQYMRMFVEQLRDLASSEQLCIMILHQCDNQFKKASPARIPTNGYAAEDKSFENNMHFCLGMGTRDKESRMSWLAAVKHREGPGGELIVEMDKDYPRLNWDKERFRYDATTKSFIKMQDGDIDHSRDLDSVRSVDKPKPEEKPENVFGVGTPIDMNKLK